MSTLVAPERDLPRVDVDSSRLPRLAVLVGITAQIALALLVIRAFRIESRTFFDVALLAVLGFLPHALLPARWRLPAFALLSLGGLAVVVGAIQTLWLLGAAVVLVGICHLPVRWSARIALLVGLGVALGAARAGYLPAPWSAGVWAVFGSMFMFRLAVYVHTLRHEPTRPTLTQTAAYFLMLPNPVFPLFPVVDLPTFVRTHYAEGTDANATYQTGAAWIARGLVHLLLYRVVYQNLPADPIHLASLGALTWYLLGTFLLYLRVSGQFHLIVGMLHLYGFALPETHKLFFLSSSFTDFWRRINIYWKDFMMKLVYYPSFFRLRRFGGTTALVVATIIVFVVTWLLHSYQWFWILGTFPLTLPDVLFWGILGALVIVTSVRESKKGRDRGLGAKKWSGQLALRVVLTFTALCVLWSLWSAESVVEWVWMWRAAANVDAVGLVVLAVLLAGGVAIAGRNWSAPKLRRETAVPLWKRVDVRTAATLSGLVLLGQPAVIDRLGPATPYVAALRQTTLNARDAAVERRGYYEKLDHAPRLGAQGWESRAKRPADWRGLNETAVFHPRADFRIYDLKPNTSVPFLRQTLTTNEWGLRDVSRTLTKPAGTVRLAVFGPSYVIGSGVADRDPFPYQLEQRLNAVVAPETGARFEVLNFGQPAQSVLQEAATFEQLGTRFAPDIALFAIYAQLDELTVSHLANVVDRRIAIPYPGLDSLLGGWHVSPRLPWAELQGLLRIAAPEVHEWAFRHIAEEARRRGITPVVLALDMPGVPYDRNAPHLLAARRAGLPVLDLTDVYGPQDGIAALKVAEWDGHPNAAGHALVADSLLAQLRRHPEMLTRLRPSAGTTTASTERAAR